MSADPSKHTRISVIGSNKTIEDVCLASALVSSCSSNILASSITTSVVILQDQVSNIFQSIHRSWRCTRWTELTRSSTALVVVEFQP